MLVKFTTQPIEKVFGKPVCAEKIMTVNRMITLKVSAIKVAAPFLK